MKTIIKIIIISMIVFSWSYKSTLKTKDGVPISRINANLQVVRRDITNEKKTIEESITVINGEEVILHDKQLYTCNRKPNDIMIIAITEDYVTISRQKLSYYSNGVHKEHTEEIIENINYNEPFSVSIDESNPMAGACAQARYSYELQFVKQ